MDDETINHFIDDTLTAIVDNFPFDKIFGYICSTNRFNQLWLVELEAMVTQRTRKILFGVIRAQGPFGFIS